MMRPLALLGLLLLVSYPQLSTADCGAENFKSNSGEAKCRKEKSHDLIAEESSEESQEVVNQMPGSSVSPASPGTAGTVSASSEEYSCLLVDALRNASLLLSGPDQIIMEEFIEMIEITILMDFSLSDDEKLVGCGYALKHFLEENYEIKQQIFFKKIGGWGSFFDLTYVVVDKQADIYESIVTLDAKGDCELFDALVNATSNDTQKYSATLRLINDIRVVLLDITWTQAQKMAKIHLIIKKFLDANPSWAKFFKGIKIPGFGTFESFHDVAHGYHRSLTISTVLVGSSDSDSPLLKSLSGAVANTSFSLSVRNQIKNYHDKLALYFSSVTDIDKRMVYLSQQYWQLIIIEPFIVPVLSLVDIVDQSGNNYGVFADLTWVSQFCNNSDSCGCMSCGLGTYNCPSRVNLIALSPQNTSVLLDVIMDNYKTWNSTTQSGFNNCKSLVIQAIYNNIAFPTPKAKINEIVKDFKGYNANNPGKQQILFNITVDAWSGQVVNFVNCGDM